MNLTLSFYEKYRLIINAFQKMAPLPDKWAACVATVFEDAVDQLAILGSILPEQKSNVRTKV